MAGWEARDHKRNLSTLNGADPYPGACSDRPADRGNPDLFERFNAVPPAFLDTYNKQRRFRRTSKVASPFRAIPLAAAAPAEIEGDRCASAVRGARNFADAVHDFVEARGRLRRD